ncbi:MAG: hypothetical protein AAF066_17620 [Pseudomonadota bacterium]
MGVRKFAQINASLLRSRKLAKCNHQERWAYVCAHLTPQGNFLGLFRYPLVLWQIDAGMGADELMAAIAKLESVGLIEFDPDEEIVRIVGFHTQRPPENASRVLSYASDLMAFEADTEATEKMLLSTSAELCVAAIKRAQEWKPDSKDWPKLRDALGQFARRLHLDHGDALTSLLLQEMADAGEAVRGEITSLLPALSLLKQTPCGHPADTVAAHGDGDGDETEIDTETEKETDTETTSVPGFEDKRSFGATELLDWQRNRERPNSLSSKAMPLSSTKDSALAKAARGG